MARRQSHAPTIYLVRRDTLPTINFTLRDNERAAPGYYLDPQDPETWRPVDVTGKEITGWFKEMCVDGRILFGIPVLRHAPQVDGRCTLLGSPSVLMDIPPGWYELEIEVKTCNTPAVQTVWKRFKFYIREDFDTTETDGLVAPIYRDANGDLQEIPISPPDCGIVMQEKIALPFGSDTHTIDGVASDVNGSIERVEYRLNGGAWFTAVGTETWAATVTGLVSGDNLIEVRAKDYQGACSTIETCVVYIPGNTAPSVFVDCGDGIVAETPNECFAGIRTGTSTFGTGGSEPTLETVNTSRIHATPRRSRRLL